MCERNIQNPSREPLGLCPLHWAVDIVSKPGIRNRDAKAILLEALRSRG
jgi:hypothetical protein